eukprot:10266518-Lingulodinium_polyedra.AAC.1
MNGDMLMRSCAPLKAWVQLDAVYLHFCQSQFGNPWVTCQQGGKLSRDDASNWLWFSRAMAMIKALLELTHVR